MRITATTDIAQSTRLSEEKRNLTTFLTTETAEWLSLSARALQALLARKCWVEEVSRQSYLKRRQNRRTNSTCRQAPEERKTRLELRRYAHERREVRSGNHLNTEATPEIIASYNPYAVVIATGACAVKPRSIEGVNLANVYTTTQILSGEVKLENKTVALIGSGMTGLETAEMLIEHDNKVAIVDMSDTLAPGTWFQHLDDIVPKLDAKGTEYILSHKLNLIDERAS